MIPMVLSLFILEGKSRLVVGYILVGTTVCIYISEINGVIFETIDRDMLYFCTTISPITEEIIKALPVLFYAFFFSNDRKKLVQSSFAVGLGFAIMENMFILTRILETGEGLDLLWVIIRGFGAGLMHSVCTVMVGLGIAFVRKKRKLFVCGTLSLLMLAITYHSLYNTIVMSEYRYFGFVLPLLTYIQILNIYIRSKGKRAEKEGELVE
ncbi:MAG: PrsW family intramembrane metalloprotease [Eubacterium sp.]|nr:PrsW family intramembrane metalloprotease [Eubacterium sp.]